MWLGYPRTVPPPPNLFDWANSELSQDAFLCWLVAHAGENGRADLRRVARAFIAWLWNRSHPAAPCDPEDVSLHSAPLRQQAHTDVFFSARIRGAVVPFLVEDKVHTSHHHGQLERYAKWLDAQRLRYGAADDVKVYFKTGYHFDEDRAAAAHGYRVVDLDDVVGFFGAHPAASDILDDYRRYVTAMLDGRRAALDGYRALGRDFVQYELLRALKARCPEHIAAGWISRGANIGGAPWTHYTIASFPKALAGIDEALYLRVDARQDDDGKRRYYLGLRQYAYVKGREATNPGARQAKLARLAEYKAHLHAARAEAGTTLRFAKVSNDYQGANESEVGLVFFDEQEHAPAAVLAAWPALHRAFIERVSVTRGATYSTAS